MKGVTRTYLEVLQALAQEGIKLSEEELLLTARSQPYGLGSANGAVASPTTVSGQQTVSRQVTAAPVQLSPSDLIFLRTPIGDVVMSMFAEAFLANEKVGAIRFDVAERKYFFGLFSTTHLRGVGTGNAAQWPIDSLESVIYRDRGSRVSDFIYDWLGDHYANPWNAAASMVKDSMVRRGLMRKEVNVAHKKWLWFSWQKTDTRYFVQESTTIVGTQDSKGSAGRLLMECRKDRPEVYSLLMSGIEYGFRCRVLSG